MTPPLGAWLPVVIESVKDGDTVVARLPGSAFVWSVRLLECWAPELKEKGGQEAKRYAQRLVASAKEVVLHIPIPKKPHELLSGVTFDRVLGYVWLDGTNLSKTMVKAGHATRRKK